MATASVQDVQTELTDFVARVYAVLACVEGSSSSGTASSTSGASSELSSRLRALSSSLNDLQTKIDALPGIDERKCDQIKQIAQLQQQIQAKNALIEQIRADPRLTGVKKEISDESMDST